MALTLTPTTRYLSARNTSTSIAFTRIELGTGNTRSTSDFAAATGVQTPLSPRLYGTITAAGSMDATRRSFDVAFGNLSSSVTAQEAALLGQIGGGTEEVLGYGRTGTGGGLDNQIVAGAGSRLDLGFTLVASGVESFTASYPAGTVISASTTREGIVRLATAGESTQGPIGNVDRTRQIQCLMIAGAQNSLYAGVQQPNDGIFTMSKLDATISNTEYADVTDPRGGYGETDGRIHIIDTGRNIRRISADGMTVQRVTNSGLATSPRSFFRAGNREIVITGGNIAGATVFRTTTDYNQAANSVAFTGMTALVNNLPAPFLNGIGLTNARVLSGTVVQRTGVDDRVFLAISGNRTGDAATAIHIYSMPIPTSSVRGDLTYIGSTGLTGTGQAGMTDDGETMFLTVNNVLYAVNIATGGATSSVAVLTPEAADDRGDKRYLRADTDLSGRATLASPAFTGNPTAPTPATGDSDTSIATTAFVRAILPPGVTVPYAGTSAPDGWLLCDGRNVSRTTYAALFNAIGTTHGRGDGSTTFGLPDMRHRVAVGSGGSGSTFLGTTVGSSGGADSVTLTIAQMPRHAHVYDTARGTALSGNTGTDGVNADSVTADTGMRGNGQPHSNVQPSRVLTYIIKS